LTVVPRSLNVHKATFLVSVFLFAASTTLSGQSTARTIAGAFVPPPGFKRTAAEAGSFATFLRALPLKPAGSQVHLFNGELKERQDVHAAVIDLSVGTTDLQQCADAVMRLRAEYLFANKSYDRISFHFTNGFEAGFQRWANGDRIKVTGNRCDWKLHEMPMSHTHENLLSYLKTVFTYAGSLSLQKELDKSTTADPRANALQPGDVFIHGGSPGHAMIVVDVATHADGRKAFLLAQSYMPAQDIHVVKNPLHPELGAWFVLSGDDRLYTPEWTFDWNDRRTW
jgi:hypothetical protein